MALKLYTSMVKGLRLKVRRFWELFLMFVEVTGEKLIGGLILNMVFVGFALIKVDFIVNEP